MGPPPPPPARPHAAAAESGVLQVHTLLAELRGWRRGGRWRVGRYPTRGVLRCEHRLSHSLCGHAHELKVVGSASGAHRCRNAAALRGWPYQHGMDGLRLVLLLVVLLVGRRVTWAHGTRRPRFSLRRATLSAPPPTTAHTPNGQSARHMGASQHSTRTCRAVSAPTPLAVAPV
jgi:hypothetical protein